MQKIIKPNVTIFGIDEDGIGKFPPYFLNRVNILQHEGRMTVKENERDKEIMLMYFSPNLYGRKILLKEICGENKSYSNEYIDSIEATRSFILDLNRVQSSDYKIWVITYTKLFPLLQKVAKDEKVEGIYFYRTTGDVCVTATTDTPTQLPMMLPHIAVLLGLPVN